jgi:hypothetical protein
MKTEQAAVCLDCLSREDAVRLDGGLTVEVGQDRLLLRRGGVAIAVSSHRVRHRADAQVAAAALPSTARWVRKPWTSGPPISAEWRMSGK